MFVDCVYAAVSACLWTDKSYMNSDRWPARGVDCVAVFGFFLCHVKLSSWREVRVYCLAVESHLAWVAIGTQMLFRHCLLA